jgi:hypothetical protein
MNKPTFRSAAAVILALSATTALHAQAQAGSYSPSDAGTIHRAPAPKPATGASYDAGDDYPTFRPPLAQGDGTREINTYCNVCHSPRYITMQPVLAAGAWSDEVNKMIKTYGATVPDDAATKIIAYLQSHYTPETRKH